MELFRSAAFLSAICAVFAAETTLDPSSTTATTKLAADTAVTEQLIITSSRPDNINLTAADTAIGNEIESEERSTSTPVRTTEETTTAKELPTTKIDSITVEGKEVSGYSETTAFSPTPLQVTERSSVMTNEVTEATSPPIRQATAAASTLTASTQRPTAPGLQKKKTRQKPRTTTATPPTQGTKTEGAVQQVPAASSVLQVTARPPSGPNRKSTVEAKKGTINTGALQQSKKRKPSKKDSGMSSLIYIPLMIQAQMIPMMLLQLKFFALKALTIGKLALIILGINLLRNAIIGYHNDEQQYEHESLASAHYGYNGGPEYGSWVNRRMYRADPEFSSYPKLPEKESRRNEHINIYDRSVLNKFTNDPYRAYETKMLENPR